MSNIIAFITDNKASLSDAAEFQNQHAREYGYSFYVNENRVSVDNWQYDLSEERQIQLLKWFLEGRAYYIEHFKKPA